MEPTTLVSSSPPNTFRIVLAAASTGWVYRAIQLISGLVTLPLIVIHLGKVEYGIWVLVGQTVSFLALSDLGTANAVSRFVARFRGQNDSESISRLLSTVIAMMLAVGVVVALLTLVLAPWVPGLLGIEGAYAGTTRLVFMIAGLSLACQFPIGIGMGILAGNQLYGPHGVGKILESILSLASVLLLTAFNALNVVTLALSSAIIAFTANAVLFALAWRLTHPWSLNPKRISVPMAKDVLSLGGSAVFITLGTLVYTQGMGIAVGRLAGLGAVAIYGVVLTLMQNLQPLIGAIGGAMPTLASEWQARGDTTRLRRIVNLTMRVTFALAVSAAAGLFVYGEPALRLLLHRAADWTTQDFHLAWGVMLIMSLGMAVGLPQMVSRVTLQATGKHWLVTVSVLAASFAALGVGALTMSAGWGVLGAATGWSLVLVFQGIFLFPPMICRFLDQSLKEMLLQAYLPGLGVGLFVLILAWGLSTCLIPDNAVNLLLGMGLTGGLGCTAVLLASGQARLVLTRLRLRRA